MADRTRRGRARLAAVGLAAMALVMRPTGPPAAAQSITVSPIDLATYYQLGEYALVAEALGRAGIGDLGVVLDTFRREGAAWIRADGDDWVESRRLTLAAVALETAHAGLEWQWERSKAILEWGCELLRSNARATEAERTWHLAAMALIQGARDMVTLRTHLDHLVRRFPAEPRTRLARAFIEESRFWDVTTSFLLDLQPGGHERALLPALDHEDTRREARLRLGYFALHAGRIEDALDHLRQVDPAEEPSQQYLAWLFEGWALERLGRPEEAVEAYRAALEAQPHAYTASVALGLRLYAAGRPDEADQLVAGAIAAGSMAPDPWRVFGYGDFRRWTWLIEQVRRELQAVGRSPGSRTG